MDQPLLERDAPLAELESLAWMAASGTGHAVFITGETGAGKTTLLLRAFEARAGGAHVLHGACEDLSTPAPLGPLRDLAQEAGADLDALIRDEADRLAVFGRVLSLAEGRTAPPSLPSRIGIWPTRPRSTSSSLPRAGYGTGLCCWS